MSQFDDYLDRVADEHKKSQTLRDSLTVAVGTSSDEFAKGRQLMLDAGMSPDLLPEPEFKRVAEQASYFKGGWLEKLEQDKKQTAAFLRDPDTAKLAYDDVDNLSMIEELFKGYTDVGRALGAGLGMGTMKAMNDIGEWGSDLAKESVAPFTDALGVGNPFAPASQYFQAGRQMWTQKQEDFQPDYESMGFVRRNILQGLQSAGQALPALATSVLTRSPTPMVAWAAGSQGAASYTDLKEGGAGVAEASRKATLDGFYEGIFERLPAGVLLKGLGDSFLKAFANSLMVELPSEAATAVAQSSTDWAFKNPDKPFFDWIKEQPENVAAAAIATISGTFAHTSMGRGVFHLSGQAAQAQANADFMRSLGERAAESKVRARAPDKLMAFLQSQAQGTEIENVSLDANAFNVYFQGQGLNPVEVAQELGIAPQTFQDTLEAGAELVIPLDQYVDKIAATEHHNALIPDVRVTPGAMTVREAQSRSDEMEQEQQQRLAQMAEELSAGTLDEPSGQVFDYMLDQLQSSGMGRVEAEQNALQMAARFATASTRWNAENPDQPLTAMDVFSRYGLAVQTDRAQAASQQLGQLDRLLDKIRREDAATDSPDEAQVMEELGVWLDEAGIDIHAVSNEDIRQQLGQHFAEQGEALFQENEGVTAEEAQQQFKDTEKAYGGKDAWQKAKDAGRTKLNYHQWVQVRTPAFKNWFGDWEALAHHQFLDGAPVSTLTGNEFAPDGVPLTEKVAKWYADNGYSTVAVDGIGDVTLDARAVKDSFAHGIGRNKALAFAAVPDVLRNGRIVHSEPMEGARDNGMVYHIAAPVSMGGKDFVVSVVVKADPKSRRMYVHEVVAKEKLQQIAAFKTRADAAEAGVRTGAEPTGAIRSVLQHIYEVNPETVSKVIDPTTGEPMVVYHGTQSERAIPSRLDFENGNPREGYMVWGKTPNGLTEFKQGAGKAMWFAPDSDRASDYASSASGNSTVYPVFLNLRNPMTYDAEGRRFTDPTGDKRNNDRGSINDMTAAAKDNGYDGTIFENIVDPGLATNMNPRTSIAVFSPNQIKSATGNSGQFGTTDNILYQRSNATRLAYESRIDALFTGSGARAKGIKILDRSDVLDILGFGDKPLHLQESAVGKLDKTTGKTKHLGMTAEQWKKVPEWIENPVAVFRSQTVPGALVMFAPELVNGRPVRITLEPNKGMAGMDVHVATNAYEESGTGTTPVDAWAQDKKALLYLNQKESPAFNERSGLRLPSEVRQLRGYKHMVQTEADLAKYRQTNGRLSQGDGSQSPRGFINIADRDRIRIALLKDRNLSTFLHESGHFYLETLRDMARETKAAASGIRKDWETIQQWLGIEGLAKGEAIPTEAHEQFARGFEAYLREGKAPSLELRGAFAAFRSWLTSLYKQLKALNVQLTPEVTRVMDRLLATDEQIAEAQQQQSYRSLFATPEMAKQLGIPEGAYAHYAHFMRLAQQEAEEKLTRRVFAELKKERGEAWKKERAEVEEKIAAEVNGRPVYQALSFLTKGRMQQGNLPAGLQPVKLSKASLLEMYDKDFLKTLPRPYVYSKEGGMHPDVIAGALGFANGHELMQALSNVPDRELLIKSAVDAEMKARHGDLMTDGSLEKEARQAVHSQAHADLLQAELRVLSKKFAETRTAMNVIRREEDRVRRQSLEGVPTLGAVRAAAHNMIKKMRVVDIRPDMYLRAERSASKEAFELAARGDYERAMGAKHRELLNHYLYLEATQSLAAAESAYKDMRLYNRKVVREKVGLAGSDWLEHFDGLLIDYQFRRATRKELDSRPPNAIAWANTKIDEGVVFAVPERLPRPVNYRELSVQDLGDVHALVKSIVHQAMRLSRIDIDGKQQELSDIALRIESEIREGGQRNKQHSITANAFIDAAGRFSDGWQANAVRPEMLMEVMNSPTLLQLMNGAQNKLAEKNIRLSGIMARLEKIFAVYTERERLALFGDLKARKEINELNNMSFTKQELLVMAMNTGNADSLAKLSTWLKIPESRIQAALNTHLEKRDWDVVQAVLDEVESMWPDIADLERRTVGIVPEKVEAAAISTPHGIYRGGYFPMVYDRRQKGLSGALSDTSQNQTDSPIGQASRYTQRGHTNERVRGVDMPILLDPMVIGKHFDEVLHDLYLRETVQDLHRVMKSEVVRAAMEQSEGKAVHQAMQRWVDVIASDVDPPQGGIALALRYGRSASTAAAMGYHLINALQNFASMIGAIEYVKKTNLLAAAASTFLHPQESVKRMREKSVYMESRVMTYNMDIRDATRRVTVLGNKQFVRKYAYWLQGLTQALTDSVTWNAAYQMAISGAAVDVRSGDESAAVAWADHVVRQTLGAGQGIDLPAIYRYGELSKTVLMYWGFFNTQGNLYYRRYRKTKTQVAEKEYGAAVVGVGTTFLLTYFMQTLIAELIGSGAPDDDDDEKKLAARVAMFPLATQPGGMQLTGYLSYQRGGVGLSPVEGFYTAAANGSIGALSAGLDAISGETPAMKEKEKRDLIYTGLALMKMPARSMMRTSEALATWINDPDELEGVGDAFYDVTRGVNR